MKTLVIISGVLTITTAAYGINVERIKLYRDNLGKCIEELGKLATESTIETIICALEKDGKILNANGEYIKDASLQGLGDAISDAATLEKARGIFIKCYDDGVQSGSTDREQTLKISKYVFPIMALFDNL